MTEQEPNRVAKLLQQSLPPIDHELRHDLWPQMLRRLDEHSAPKLWFAAMFSPANLGLVPWFDWVLLAVLVLGLCLYPKSIPIWLYNF